MVENAFTHVFGKFKNVPCLILKKEITDEQYDKIHSVINSFVENHNTYSYDFLNLFLAKTHLKVDNENRFFCSEFVAYVLSEADIHVPNIKEKIRPIEFCNVEDTEVIYRGELKEWCKKRQTVLAT